MNEEQSNIMLNNALSVKNASIMKKFLTKDNFEVVRITPVKPTKNARYNTVVEIRQVIDPDTMPLRYKTTTHKFMRVDIKEALRHLEIRENKNGSFVVESIPDDLESFIEDFKSMIGFVAEDITFSKVGDNTCAIQARTDSLGFTGFVTLTTEIDGENPVDPEVPTDPK